MNSSIQAISIKWIQYVFVFGCLFYGLYSVPIALFETDLSMIPGDFGDARFNNYILEHGYKYLTGDVKSYWDAPIMFPFRNTIAFSDNLLGTMPIYAVFRAFQFDRETSFQLWIIVLFALNYLSSFWVLNKWFKNIPLAITGAYIFAFGVFIIGQMDHIQVFPRFIAPLVFYWFWNFLNEGKTRHFLLTLLGIVFQFYCAVYLGFILVYCLMFLTISHSIIFGFKGFLIRTQIKNNYKTLALISAVCLMVFLPLIVPYIQISRVTGMRNFNELISTIPKPQSYFFTHIGATTWKGILSEHSKYAFNDWWFHFMFVGAIPWIGIIIAILILIKKPIHTNLTALKAFIITLVLCVLFTTNFFGFTLYKIIHSIPGFSSMRSIDRFINIQSFLFILVFVAATSELAKKNKSIGLLFYLLPFLSMYENKIEKWELKRFDKMQAQNDIQSVKNILKLNYNKRAMAVAFMVTNNDLSKPSYHDKLIKDHLTIMIAAQELNVNLVNAYTGHYPDHYMNFFDKMNEPSLIEWLNASGNDGHSIQRIYHDVGEMNE
jgi:hypothetical protein